jgi:hypothetical protein
VIRRLLGTVLSPVARLLMRLLPLEDPWERLDLSMNLRQHAYAAAGRRDPAWYFEGQSTITVGSLEDVSAWLATCGYASDEDLFREADFWQHPCTFEHMRKGDCEDFALWAWRKLVELEYDADLVTGWELRGEQGRHAWIVFRRDGEEYLFEPAWAKHPPCVWPLAEVRGFYIPEFGLGPDLRRFAFAGALCLVKDPTLARWRPAEDAVAEPVGAGAEAG